MSLKTRVADDLKSAMKARDSLRLSVLRMMKTKLSEAEVELRGSKGRDHEIDDDEAVRALSSYAKQRREAIASFESAKREDLAEKERRELTIVEEYLPRQLTDDEVREIVRSAIAETGASSPKELGQVMRDVMPRLTGRADGKRVGAIVREELG
ncbi:MAG: GatB/YqeY domain-containing protein [Acidobacteriota bacterium]|nr:GatB/YqeY domain-containing protein [Acidobacteriota bacterium]